MAEYAARIGRIVADAFLIGYAVFGCMHKILRGSDQANDREKAEGYCEISAIVVIITQVLTKIGANILGNVARTTAAGAAFLHVLHHLDTKHDGVNYLNDRLRHVLFAANCYGSRAEIIAALTGFEDIDVALAAVKHYGLFKHGNSLEFLGSAVDACFKDGLNIEANGNRIKAPVELYGFNIDMCPTNLGAFYTNVSGMLNDFLTEISQEDAYVFEAIAVSARVQDAIGFNTHRFLAGIARKSVFRHGNTS